MMMLMVSNLETLVNLHSVCKHPKSVNHFVKKFVDILFLSSPPPPPPHISSLLLLKWTPISLSWVSYDAAMNNAIQIFSKDFFFLG